MAALLLIRRIRFAPIDGAHDCKQASKFYSGFYLLFRSVKDVAQLCKIYTQFVLTQSRFAQLHADTDIA